jgi:hypothetical protein
LGEEGEQAVTLIGDRTGEQGHVAILTQHATNAQVSSSDGAGEAAFPRKRGALHRGQMVA